MHQLVHRAADLVIGLIDARSVKLFPDLAENVVVARFLYVGNDDLLRVCFGIGTTLTELFRRPKPEQLVASSSGLEAQFLIEDELALETFFAILHTRHGVLRLGIRFCSS